MPANIECPCGHTVRVPDELTNTRIKCPVCGELLSAVAVQPDDSVWEATEQSPVDASKEPPDATTDSPQPTKSEADASDYPDLTSAGRSRTASNFHGKGAFLFAGLPMPSLITESRVALLPERVRIKSKGLFGNRHLDLRLSEVTSVETRRCPGWYLLLLAILFLPANGVGLIFLLSFLFIRHSYLIIRCGNASVAIRFSGDDTDAISVGDAILSAAQSG
jgi:hypothetical protein